MSKARALSSVDWLRQHGSEKFRSGLVRYGLPIDRAFGVPVGTIQKYGKTLGRDHRLAQALWATGWTEARMLAAFVGEPDKVSPGEMDRWCEDFDSWGIVDTVCFKLWDRSPHAWRKAVQWSTRRPEFEKRAGYVLMACLAAHDKTVSDDVFCQLLPLIERGAFDDRNFVKKGVSWALRHIGHRSARLHAVAVKTATKLAASGDSTQRWVGKDALKDLTRPAVIRKVMAR